MPYVLFIDFFDIKINKTTIYDVSPGDLPQWVVIDISTGRERNTREDEEDDGNDLA